jgi:hypothetical protein
MSVSFLNHSKDIRPVLKNSMASKKNQKISQQELIEKQLWKAANKLRELAIVLFERIKVNASIDWTVKERKGQAESDRQKHIAPIWLPAGHAETGN